MGSSAIPAAVTAKDPALIRAALVAELVPVIPATTDPATWDPRELGASGGNVWPAVIWQNAIWYRDDTSVAAADNSTCIILADGGHYLTNDVKFPQTVEARTLATPPDSAGTDPTVIGKAWRIAAGATDTWAGHEDDVAMGSGRGWQFHTPSPGEEHYVRAEKLYETFTEDNVWEDRVSALPAASIPPSAFLWDNRVQNQTTNSPPATWSKGVAYIIGSSASGDWSGNAGKIALAESDGVLVNGDTFTIITPYVGQEVYDIDLTYRVRWNGTAWQSARGAWIGFARVAPGTGSLSHAAGSVYVFSTGTAPTTAVVKSTDTGTISQYTARSGTVLRFRWRGYVTWSIASASSGSTAQTNPCVIALRRDSETSAIAWWPLFDADKSSPRVDVEFIVTASDGLAHDYEIWLVDGYIDGGGVSNDTQVFASAMAFRNFTLEEAA